MTKELQQIEEDKRTEAEKHGFDKNAAMRNWIMKTDNASGDNMKDFEKYQAKIEARKQKILVAEEQ